MDESREETDPVGLLDDLTDKVCVRKCDVPFDTGFTVLHSYPLTNKKRLKTRNRKNSSTMVVWT